MNDALTGRSLGQATYDAQKAAGEAFLVAYPNFSKLPKAEQAAVCTALALQMAQLAGDAVEAAIEARTPRICVGTNTTPDPTQFQDGDIYFLREE